jgi:hypothetical protein
MKFHRTALALTIALIVGAAALVAPSAAGDDPMVSIEIDGAAALKEDLNQYPARAQRILVRALNRAIASSRTAMVREIAADTHLKSKDVRDALVMRQATINRPEASLEASLKRIPLFKFGAKASSRGVSHKGRSGRIPDAFIATTKSGHQGVFRRAVGANRRGPAPHHSQLPIIELKGPSLGRVFEKFRPIGLARAEEAFRTNLEHELSRIRGD